MATVSSAPDQVADSFKKLSLDSQTKTTNVTEPTKQDFYGYNGSHMYPQSYGYNAYGTYPASPFSAMGQDFQQQMLQEYHYPDQGSLSVETSALANAGVASGNNGTRARPTSQKTSLNQNSSYRKEGFPACSPSPGFQGYDASLAVPWYDASMSTNARSKHGASSEFSSYNSNSSSGRNQNLHPYPQYMNGSATSGLSQAYGFMNQIYPNSMNYGHYGNVFGHNSGLGSYGYGSWKKGMGWYPVGNYSKSRNRGYGNGKENINGLDEMNRGPRVKVYKNQNDSEPVTVAVKEQNGSLSANNKGDNLLPTPDVEQYNKEDFPESYSDAKFFVIKSYSEDDVHKSVKYGVWASTSNGNKKLDAAYQEAKEKPDGCPVFLLFSVNTSGQFVGIAEMVGPVDFNKTLEYWQQDKWVGCFPVKWHIVRDVPNGSLRHITLENNENKPVTNSRDTQEVNLEQGIQILKIFKNHSSKTCILDDFEFYESRQKVMQEKKSKYKPPQKQVLGQPAVAEATDNSEKATIDKEVLEKSVDAAIIEESSVSTTAESVKVNGEAEDAPAKPVSVASAC